jgi:HK97 family phage portal protein
MGLLSRIFQKRQPPKGIAIELTSAFTAASGGAYANAQYRAAADAIARHSAKLAAHSEDAGLEALLQGSPNSYMTIYDLLYKAATHYFITNNAFLYIERGRLLKSEETGVTAIYNLSPSSVEFEAGPDGSLWARFLFPGGETAILPYSDIIHLRRHFSNSELLGADNAPLSPLVDAAETLTQATAKAAQNATNIRGVLKFTSLLNPAQLKLEKEQFSQDYLGISNTGGIAVTDMKADFVPTSTAPYILPHEQVASVNAQICSYLGVSPRIVDGAFSEDEFQSFYEAVLEPLALQMSLEFTRKCGAEVTFTSERLEFSSARTRISLLRELLPFGVVSINEARRLLALPEVEDGDRRLQSLNYVTADKADISQLEDTENGETQLSS